MNTGTAVPQLDQRLGGPFPAGEAEIFQQLPLETDMIKAHRSRWSLFQGTKTLILLSLPQLHSSNLCPVEFMS